MVSQVDPSDSRATLLVLDQLKQCACCHGLGVPQRLRNVIGIIKACIIEIQHVVSSSVLNHYV